MSQIKLIHASSVEQECDAIVNAANKYLMAGSGVCGAIFAKAGYEELMNACQSYNLPLNDGDAVITPSFGIKNAKYIIHAVGPNFNITPNAYDKLYNAYFNSLEVLKENDLHSISFPLISSGIYGGKNPVVTSLRACYEAYNNFILKYKDYDIDVVVCAYSIDEYNEALKV